MFSIKSINKIFIRYVKIFAILSVMKFTVGQLAKIFDISAQSIHSYVEMGILPCHRDENGYRIFDEYGFQILGGIIKNRNSGFSLKESDYTYTNVDPFEIIDKMIERKEQISHQMRRLHFQAQQLETDIIKLNQFLLRPEQMKWVTIDKMVRFNLGSVDVIIQKLKEDEKVVSKWYSNLFYCYSSVDLIWNEDHIEAMNFGLISTYSNFNEFIDIDSKNTSIIDSCNAISVLTSYNNRISINQLEGLIQNVLVKYKEYCLQSNPYTRLVTSYNDQDDNKVNIIELTIPLKKR